MSIASLYPSINPSLLLDFANSKVLDSRVTFTRTTTATYYDGVTTAKAEENLLTYSQEFDNAAWTKGQSSITANSTTAPDGTSTADTFTDNSTAGTYHYTNQTASFVYGTTYVLSCYAKNNNGQYIGLSAQNDVNSYAGATFDLVNGTFNTGQAGAGWSASASMTSVGNGWYRCVVAITSGITSTAIIQIYRSNSSSGPTGYGMVAYTGSGQSVYIWGAQLEQRSSATAYTATTTQAITNYIPVLQTASAGQARFDHNPTTGESLGLLIEEARTNACPYSEAIGSWSAVNATAQSNVTIAPSGALTADKILPDATASVAHGWYNTITAAASTTYTASIFAKAAEYSWLYLTEGNNVTATAWFNLSTGALGTVTGTGSPSATITSVGNGWYRCSLTFTTAVGATAANIQARVTTADNTNSFTASSGTVGYSGIFVWGGQFETGSFATSYIPNLSTGSTTRNADAASMTGTNFSSWFGNGEGTVYTEFAKFGVKVYGYLYSISNGATNEEISLNFDSAGTILYARIYSGGGYQMQATLTSSVTDNVFYRNSFGFEVNNSAASWNAGAVVTDSVCTIPNCNALVLAASAAGSDIQSCRIKKFAFYPQRVSNTNLVALTT